MKNQLDQFYVVQNKLYIYIYKITIDTANLTN